MVTPGFVYWVTRLDVIRNLMGAASVIVAALMILIGLFVAVMMIDGEHEKVRDLSGAFRWSAVAAVVFAFLYALTPSTREMAAIYVVPKVANSESVREIGGEYGLALEWLREMWRGKKEAAEAARSEAKGEEKNAVEK